MAPRSYAEFVALTLDRLLNCSLHIGMNEELFSNGGARFARETGLGFHRSGGLLGASLIQRAAAPALAVQGVGSAVKDVAAHIELLQLMYNESRPPTSHMQRHRHDAARARTRPNATHPLAQEE